MRILIVNDSSTPSGGAEIMSLTLRDALRERGHEALLFSSRARYGSAPIAADATCFGSVSPVRQILRMANPSAYWQLRKLLRQFRPDVVHVRMMTTQLSSLILPLLRDYPALYHVTWQEAICPTGMKTLPDLSPCQVSAGIACWQNGCVSSLAWPFIATQYRWLNRWRDVFTRVVPNSHYTAEQLLAAGWPRVEVIWNGVQVVEPRPPLVHPPTIAYAGRLVAEKGVETVLRAFPLLRQSFPSLRLLVVGDGPQRQYLERICQELAISSAVEMTGALPRDQAEQRLKGAWVQLVPTVCQESFASVAAEAQMRGTAVVAARRGSLPEVVIDGETGTIVEPQDPQQLALAIHPYLADRNWAEQVGQAGRARAMREFRLETCVAKFVDLYAQMIAEHQLKSKTKKRRTQGPTRNPAS
jgi:glycosyltransferase involved in cell wall biosynthesis